MIYKKLMNIKPEISRNDFEKVDMRVGTVIDVQPFPNARTPAWRLRIDFGDNVGTKKTSAQITDFYTGDNLLWKQVIWVVNFPPKQIGKFMSECLVLWLCGDDAWITLLTPERKSRDGLYVS